MNLLEVTHLKKQFNQTEAVKDITFSVGKGESYGLLGPNGAGKSTIIHMISGLFPPSSGSIMLSGIDMVRHPKKAQGLIGIVPQEIALYETLSASENLAFWGRMYGLKGVFLKKRISDVLEIIGLQDRSKDKVSTFSGGMKRRVNIGAAILHEPELLIMDEPTVGIDPQSRTHILETVQALNNMGMTIIYTSHYMEEVEYLCKKIGIMDHGQFIATGTMAELRDMIGDRSHIKMKFAGKISSGKINGLLDSQLDQKDRLIQDNELTLFHKQPQLALSGLIQTVTGAGIEIASVEIVEPNLESVFLHLTGRNLRD